MSENTGARQMKHVFITLALLSTPALAVDPDTLSRSDKDLFLKCAYVLHKRTTSTTLVAVDLSGWNAMDLEACASSEPARFDPPEPKPVKTVQLQPDPPATIPNADICRRHGKKKVTTRGGKSWRCR
jgi:hypothetical protein